MIDYHIELVKFPSTKTHEAVTINEDGSATIFLDQNDTKELQQKDFCMLLSICMEMIFISSAFKISNANVINDICTLCLYKII